MLNSGEVIIGVIVKSSEPVETINRDDGLVEKFYRIVDLMCLNINTGELFPTGTVDIDSLYGRPLYLSKSVKEDVKSKYLVLRCSADGKGVVRCGFADTVGRINELLDFDTSFPIFDKENNLIRLTGDDEVSIRVSNYGYTKLAYKDYSMFSSISVGSSLTPVKNPLIATIEMQDTDYFTEVSSGVWTSTEDCYADGDIKELLIADGIKRVVIVKDTVKSLVLSKTVDIIKAKRCYLTMLNKVYISKEASISCICHLLALFNDVATERFGRLGLDDTDVMDTICQCMKYKSYEYMWEYCNREENQYEMAEILSNVEILVY
jgi:hypothetical protein